MYRLALLLVTLLLGPCLAGPSPARAGEVRVLASAAVKPLLDGLAPRFEGETGHRLVVQYGTGAGLRSRIEAGEPFDVALLASGPADDLARSGRLSPEPRPVIGVTAASLAYRTGGTRPDVGTSEALRAALLGAASISLSDPALGGASSSFFTAAVKRLGLEEALRGKLVLTGAGDGARPVATGAAEFGVALSSEVAGVEGVSAVPLLPGDPAATTRLVAAISSAAAEPDGARSLVRFLLSPEAMVARRARGLAGE